MSEKNKKKEEKKTRKITKIGKNITIEVSEKGAINYINTGEWEYADL